MLRKLNCWAPTIVLQWFIKSFIIEFVEDCLNLTTIFPSIDRYYLLGSYSPAYTPTTGWIYIELKHAKKCHEAFDTIVTPYEKMCTLWMRTIERERYAQFCVFCMQSNVRLMVEWMKRNCRSSSQLQNIQEEAMKSGKTKIKYRQISRWNVMKRN